MVSRSSRLIGSLVVSLGLAVISLADVGAAVTAPLVTVLTPPITDGVRMPVRVVFDAKGDLLVADPRMGGISVFGNQGSLQDVIKVDGVVTGVAVDDRGNLLVAKGDSVVMIDRTGKELGVLGSGAGQFGKATGIAIDAAGYVYVADSRNSNVKVFTSAGKIVKVIGAKGSDNGQFNAPTGIAYEKASNQIAVADTGNGRIQFFNASGNFDYVKTIGALGTAPLQFRTPVGLTFEYSSVGALLRMYVADTYQNNVQVVEPSGSGSYLSTIAARGFSSGDIMIPVDVAFDKLNHRLLVANASGQITRYGIDGGVALTAASQTLGIDPVPYSVKTSSVVITGTVAAGSNIVVKTATGSTLTQPVTYTSANTWKCTVSGLVKGANTIVVKAVNVSGILEQHAVSLIYAP